jgi:outer membrane protein assembly factor BamB
MVLGADQGKGGAAAGPMAAWPRVGAGIAAGLVRAAGPWARRRAMAAVSCAAMLAGLGAAAPAAVAAGRGHGAATAGRAAVPGSQLWASRFNGPPSTGDFARAVAAGPGGATVFVTGTIGGPDYGTVAYNAATGAQRWFSRYNGPASGADEASSVAVSPDGAAVFVTGTSHSDYGTVAYNAATGAQLWASRYHGPSNDSASSVAVSPDGSTVFVTGTSRAGPTGTTSGLDYATVAYNAATGAQLWASRYNGPANSGDFAFSVAVSPAGATVFVTGASRGATSRLDYATVAYNAATGAQRWASRYNAPANRDDRASSLAVSPGGATIFVTGTSRGRTSGLDYATVAYNAATGARRWVSRYNGPRNADDSAVAVAAGPGGQSVFVTGTSKAATRDYATLAYNAATGAPRWARRYNGPARAEDDATSLAVSPGGSAVVVTGTSYEKNSGGTTLRDYATVAYNAAGARLWASRFRGPAGRSDASALAVSPDGTKVFVTGTSSLEYTTVAYKR